MSLLTSVFALQQIELHLEDLNQPLTQKEATAVISRIRILAVSTLLSVGILGELPTDENSRPLPVELPSYTILADTMHDLTEQRESGRE
jgi:hypothetical protein